MTFDSNIEENSMLSSAFAKEGFHFHASRALYRTTKPTYIQPPPTIVTLTMELYIGT